METKGFIDLENLIKDKCLSWLFPLHFNTYVMGLRPLEIFEFFQREARH